MSHLYYTQKNKKCQHLKYEESQMLNKGRNVRPSLNALNQDNDENRAGLLLYNAKMLYFCNIIYKNSVYICVNL